MNIFCSYIIKFLDASVAVLGGFFPVLILMYIHYRIRKSNYKKTIPIFENLVQSHKDNKARIEDLLEKTYQLVGVKDISSWIEQLKSEHKELFDMANQLETDKFKNKMDIITDEGELDRLKMYSFKDYITNILNKSYPDNYFSRNE